MSSKEFVNSIICNTIHLIIKWKNHEEIKEVHRFNVQKAGQGDFVQETKGQRRIRSQERQQALRRRRIGPK